MKLRGFLVAGAIAMLLLLLGLIFASKPPEPEIPFKFARKYKFNNPSASRSAARLESWWASFEGSYADITAEITAELGKPVTEDHFIAQWLDLRRGRVVLLQGKYTEHGNTVDGNNKKWVTITVDAPREPTLWQRIWYSLFP